jgi:hypothetical protein
LDNLVEEVRPHDDTAWEAYIEWYTPEEYLGPLSGFW